MSLQFGPMLDSKKKKETVILISSLNEILYNLILTEKKNVFKREVPILKCLKLCVILGVTAFTLPSTIDLIFLLL